MRRDGIALALHLRTNVDDEARRELDAHLVVGQEPGPEGGLTVGLVATQSGKEDRPLGQGRGRLVVGVSRCAVRGEDQLWSQPAQGRHQGAQLRLVAVVQAAIGETEVLSGVETEDLRRHRGLVGTLGDADNDTVNGGAGNDSAWGGDGSDLFIFQEGGGTDFVSGGDAGGWTDTIELQNSGGADPTAGWTYNLTSGSISQTGADYLVLSDDAAGTITLADGSEVTFEGIERIEW